MSRLSRALESGTEGVLGFLLGLLWFRFRVLKVSWEFLRFLRNQGWGFRVLEFWVGFQSLLKMHFIL